MEKQLSASQIAVLLAVIRSHCSNHAATTEDLATKTGLSDMHVRRVIDQLEELGYVKKFRAVGLGMLGEPLKTTRPVTAKTAIYVLAKSPKQILDEKPEIIEWARTIQSIKNRKELEKKLGMIE